MEKQNAVLEETVVNLLAWFRENARDLPWRRTKDPYAIWISEVMLQQTQVKTVIPYWERWMRILPKVQDLAIASMDDVLKLWEGLGYYNRARNLQKAARLIVEKHFGTFPTREDDILALPGIGRYTSGAIRSIAFLQPAPILDGNVMRVLCRIFNIHGNPKSNPVNQQLWRLAEKLVAKASSKESSSSCSALNQALMELGATLCTPKSPVCAYCPLKRCCQAFLKGMQEYLPELPKRIKISNQETDAFIFHIHGKLLLRKTPLGSPNAGLWELPNISAAKTPSKSARDLFGLQNIKLKLFTTLKHSIMNTRYNLKAYLVEMSSQKPLFDPSFAWCSWAEVEKKPFSGAHRRIVDQILKNKGFLTGKAQEFLPDRFLAIKKSLHTRGKNG